MSIVVETAGVGERFGQRIFTGVAERRVAEVVSQAQGFGQVLIEAESAGDGAPDLRDFDAGGQADAKVVAVRGYENLRLVA